MFTWRSFLQESTSAFRPMEGERPVAPSLENVGRSVPEGWLLTGLVALCLLPRLFLAWRLNAVCDDGMYYIYVADCLDRGKFAALFQFLSLNVYPAILLWLHRLGLDWVVAGKLWGLLASTLLVFPLYHLVRQMCDRPTAALAVLVYAVHPELIEFSVEPTRDTTFFLFLVTALWCLQRAVSTWRWGWFLATGVVATLAVHTRLEGWFLFPVIVLWSLRRAWLLPERRWFLAAGNAWCLACIPIFVFLVNVTFFREREQWELGRINDLYTLRNLVLKAGTTIGLIDRESAAAVVASAPVTGMVVEQRHEATDGSWIYLRQLTGGIKWVTLWLICVGLSRWKRVLRDFDFAVLGGVAGVLVGLIGIRLMFLTDINGRYFLTPLLFAMFVPAVGLRRILAEMTVRFPSAAHQRRVAFAVVGVVAIAGLIDVARVRHPRRIAELKLARHLQKKLDPASRVIVDVGMVRVGSAFQGQCPHVEWNPINLVNGGDPEGLAADVLMFRARGNLELAPIREQGRRHGLFPVTLDDSEEPPDGQEYLILAKPSALLGNSKPAPTRVAGEPPASR